MGLPLMPDIPGKTRQLSRDGHRLAGLNTADSNQHDVGVLHLVAARTRRFSERRCYERTARGFMLRPAWDRRILACLSTSSRSGPRALHRVDARLLPGTKTADSYEQTCIAQTARRQRNSLFTFGFLVTN